MPAHLVWDWNGTLYCDIDAIVGATNDAFAAFDLPPLSHDAYRATFTRPLTAFYANAFGRPLTASEYERIETVFYDAYHRRMSGCGLAAGAVNALTAWRGRGHTQSLLSLWTHDELVRYIDELRLTHHFLRVEGRRGVVPNKAGPLARHLRALGTAPASVVVVGDSLDDAAAAEAVGAACVLYDGGSHNVAELVASGWPVATNLAEAVALAEELGGAARRDRRIVS